MEPQEFDFSQKEVKLSREMQETIERTHAALQQMWAREKQEAQTVYEISIPAQTLTIFGKEHAEHALRELKSLKGTEYITYEKEGYEDDPESDN